MTYSDDEGEVFLGRSVTQHKMVSDETAHSIDEEVREIVDRNYGRAKSILESNLEKLHVMAETLIKYETIDSDQIDDIMKGEEPGPPTDWVDEDKSSGPPSTGEEENSESTNQDASNDDEKGGTIGGRPASSH